jgi:hypothetical protein
MMLKEHAKRADYALARMDAAYKRMNTTALWDDEWESALKWATAWGVAIRTGPRCARAKTCKYRSDACRLGKSNRPFSEG